MVAAAGVKGSLLGFEYIDWWTCPCAGNKATGNGPGYDPFDAGALCTGTTLAAAPDVATAVALVLVEAVADLVRLTVLPAV